MDIIHTASAAGSITTPEWSQPSTIPFEPQIGLLGSSTDGWAHIASLERARGRTIADPTGKTGLVEIERVFVVELECEVLLALLEIELPTASASSHEAAKGIFGRTHDLLSANVAAGLLFEGR
jgi:hypothetical protein